MFGSDQTSWPPSEKIEAATPPPDKHPPPAYNTLQPLERMSSANKNSYIPPHLRAAAAAKKAAEPPTPADLTSRTLFPSLGGVKHKISSNLTVERVHERPTLNFKKTIDDLIAFEKRSEIEKEAAREAAAALEGFVTLPLKITPEFRRRFNDGVARAIEIEKERELFGYMVHLPPSPTNYMDDEDYTVISDDDSDSM